MVDLPSQMTYAKIQPQDILGSGEEDFYWFLPYMGMAAILVKEPMTILAIFHSPNLRRLHMKFEQNWPRGSREEVVWNSEHFSHTNA